MEYLGKKFVLQLGFICVISSMLFACNTTDGSFFPQVASPPPFDYADGEELRSRMHQLAFSLQQLDVSLMLQDENPQNAQASVVSELRDIERIASVLEGGDLSTTHRFLRNDMERFILDVRRALRDAERSPPNLYAAGRVSGGCVNCHAAASR